MKAIVYQMDVKWMDKEANLQKIAEAASMNKGDIMVLPEMFNTGYIMHPENGAEKEDGSTIAAMKKISHDSGMLICGSIPFESSVGATNSFVAVSDHGIEARYDKIHLFTPSGEAKEYASGHETSVFSIGEWNIRPLICYDLRFPYVSSNKDKAFDVIIYCANWPVARIQQWRALLVARAIENQCYVIGVNRVGTDENGYEYNGNSLIIDFKGNILADAGDREGIIEFELNKADLLDYRKSLPFLEDMKWPEFA